MEAYERITGQIEAGQIEQVEDAWLTRQAEDPTDLDFFLPVATLLSRSQEEETAVFLLELLDEQLQASGHWRVRLELLEGCGLLYLDPAGVHAAVITTLDKLYSDSKSLPGLIERTGLHRAIEDTPKTWTKVRRLLSLMQFEEDTFVWMSGKGPGVVTEVNLELESFKVELRSGSEIRVGFAAAAKMLEALDVDHIERRKVEDLDALLELKRDDPGELLVLALESRGRPLTAAEVRHTLQGVVDEGEWTSWWSRARKHPRILTSTARGRQTYDLAASEDHALDDVRAAFLSADWRQRLEILRQNADRSEDLRREMLKELARTAESSLHERPTEALNTWFALERHGAHGELDWSASSLIQESGDPVGLATALDDRALRERFYDLCWTVREDRTFVYRRALDQEPEPRLLSKLAEQLGHHAPDELKSAVDDVLGHPRRRPAAFVWLVESGEGLGAFAGRNPLRLIRQILDALHHSEFGRYRSRLLGTFEPGGGAAALFARLSEDQASQAEDAVKRSSLEEHQRDALVRYLHARYPALDRSRESSLYATEASIAARRSELERLQTEEIPANRKAIEEARELGDLRENFEYKSARQRHEYLNARLASLKSDLSRVVPLRAGDVDTTEVRAGCRVDLASASGDSRSITVLGPWESDPDNHIVSYDSDLGQSLLGKKTGDEIVIDGTHWTLTEIAAWQ